ncbi:vitamin K epoxide reductase complex subunit 1 [Homo sapiens]|uniref:Vitamin K epoxide reductase complex subunit 1 n=3 Tax=Homininae TaxID=207598 RepID=F2Z3Q2_HUMAN|nr:vitamin K epoxide reductase complex subunit 1 [Homo sapiens]KAI4054663.1 vitamin K epoxide reductase complex subunit 1 [Homo sapiens]
MIVERLGYCQGCVWPKEWFCECMGERETDHQEALVRQDPGGWEAAARMVPEIVSGEMLGSRIGSPYSLDPLIRWSLGPGCCNSYNRTWHRVGQGFRAGGACAGTGQHPQSIQQHIRLHLLHTTAIVRLPADTLGLCPDAAELPGVSRWFCLPGLDPVLRAL